MQHLRIDVAGVAVYVRSEYERAHLETVTRLLAHYKLALAKHEKSLSTHFEAAYRANGV